ncbi:Rieske Fe-S protein [Rhizopus microsporus var. microsporus]|uniref:Cytochrome b-c1 complex subunit Rieske, mitochondrial n=2 Tax=Rhizopus microsporus TaxID=58291 RepID=A0A2G4SM55_RHIZD|nr:ubiquinol cytochrome reductase [Rhizopus microsporus ATCC 52813]ORE06236.1 Rieske Fe-S protein [Rhizopus microsporus var. microsporus]PHZ09854.1 ubiquinol cytochrome reductase [Rhizopus microsporus ATCC 52813]
MASLARTFASSLVRRSHSTIPASGSALRHVSIGFSKDDQKDEAKRSNAFTQVRHNSTTTIPDFSKYKKTKHSGEASRNYAYMMVGATGLVSAAGAQATVSDFLANMSASADVLALAKAEVDLASIPEGKNVTIKWRGKPVFIRHRTEAEIAEANQVNITELRDPQQDAERVKDPKWLVMLGVCTHLGCVPIGEAGDYGGWYCPCHGSHYDISGRIRKGPAPLNLEIPEYNFQDGKLIVG